VSAEEHVRREVRRLLPAVRRILWEDWDPIGCGVPEDEYDDYVPDVVRLLLEGADPEVLERHLRETAKAYMAVSVPERRLATVVEKLIAARDAR
jgi:hypothetical protein